MARPSGRGTKASAQKRVLRVAVGVPEEPFAPPWRFWTHGDSAYFAQRSLGSTLKASFHPAGGKHKPAVWTHGLTYESKQLFHEIGSRRSHTWQQAPEFMPGWYQGPSLATPRLRDRPYDFPPTEALFHGMPDVLWVDPPAVDTTRFLTLFLSDARPDLPPFELPAGGTVVGTLPMSNGWYLSLFSAEAPTEDQARPNLEKIRDEAQIGVSAEPRAGSYSGAIFWVTTSPDGRPLFVQIVLGSDNFYKNPVTSR